MTCAAFLVPLAPPSIPEMESRHNMVKSYEYYQTPIDEAVMAVKEAQDSVGKDMWFERVIC